MKNKQIGTNIKNERIKKKLTTEQVANAINIKVSKYEKIENGTGNITTEIIYKLSNILDVKVDTLLKLEKNEKDKLLIMYIKEKKKERKIKYLGIIALLIIFSMAIILAHSILSNKSWSYMLKGESENFKYDNSIFIYDNKTYYYIFGNMLFKNDDIDENDIISIRLMCNDRLIVGSSNILTQALREHKGYDEYFSNEVVNDLDNWYFEIKYKYGEETKTEILNLKNVSI